MIHRFLSLFVPYPLLALFLFVMWMSLGQTWSPGQIILGLVVSAGGAWAMSALKPDKRIVRRPISAVRLSFNVMVDVVRSNIAVARIILRPANILHPGEGGTSRFMTVHLDLQNPTGLALLSCILTATPGTIWTDYDRASGTLLLHILDLVDEETWTKLIKGRYEQRLMEIFE